MTEKVLSLNFQTEPGYLYFIDPEGDLSRVMIQQWMWIKKDPGSDQEHAIIIEGDSYEDGFKSEYVVLSHKYGVRAEEWELVRQELTKDDLRTYDKMNIRIIENNEIDTIFFDITQPFSLLASYKRDEKPSDSDA
jgi:hypothetical protein